MTLSTQIFSMHTHIFGILYKCKKKSTNNQKSFTNVFLMHTQIFIVLNICNKNPQIYVFKKYLQFSSKHMWMLIHSYTNAFIL